MNIGDEKNPLVLEIEKLPEGRKTKWVLPLALLFVSSAVLALQPQQYFQRLCHR